MIFLQLCKLLLCKLVSYYDYYHIMIPLLILHIKILKQSYRKIHILILIRPE